jgi:hypothetical protein
MIALTPTYDSTTAKIKASIVPSSRHYRKSKQPSGKFRDTAVTLKPRPKKTSHVWTMG